MMYWEQVSPSHVGKGGFAPIMRLAGVIGVGAGFMLFYQRSISTFYIWRIGTFTILERGKIQKGNVRLTESVQCDSTA